MGSARAGSNPADVANFVLHKSTGQWSSGMILASGARGRGFDSPLAPLFMTESYALVAQMVERKTLNLVVVGSIPTGGVLNILFFFIARKNALPRDRTEDLSVNSRTLCQLSQEGNS